MKKKISTQVVVYCDIANAIGILDWEFKDKTLIGFYVGRTFRVTAFPVFLGVL